MTRRRYSLLRHRKIHLTTIQKILAEHEGFLRQFLVDDKVRFRTNVLRGVYANMMCMYYHMVQGVHERGVWCRTQPFVSAKPAQRSPVLRECDAAES